MIQAKNCDLWFATTNGVTRYDGKRFTNLTTEDGLTHNQVWTLLEDRSGIFWFGTDGGVCRYDGKSFTPFPLPVADISNYPGAYPAEKLVYNIVEDRSGDVWLATNGLGVFRYDGKALTNISKKDGLVSDVVIHITESKNGDLWFACTEGYPGPDKEVVGGVTRYDGKHFTSYTAKEGLTGNMVWNAQEDSKGNIWIATGKGIDRYDGKTLPTLQ
jgi:ligand-binding sensor domain-containing protein